jgi:alginate production protein
MPRCPRGRATARGEFAGGYCRLAATLLCPRNLRVSVLKNITGGVALGCLLLACSAWHTSARAEGARTPAGGDDLRERLTEREDKRRPLRPTTIDVAGHPLTLSGEYEIGFEYLRRRTFAASALRPERVRMEQSIEGEAFYGFGPVLSLFAQARAVYEHDVRADARPAHSGGFAERGEMWLHGEHVGGSAFNFDIGRLHFEDDRRWWYDSELDALRLTYETKTLEGSVALARELAPVRFDRAKLAPEQDGVLRLIGEIAWDWRPNHEFKVFLLHQNDRSRTESAGQIVNSAREDDADARLTWLGLRWFGAARLGNGGLFGYWLDSARLRGNERRVEYEPLAPKQSEVQQVRRRDVSAWAFDLGANWALPLAIWEPRLYAGYAVGSGDALPERGADRAFRQSGLQANEAGFGGVRRFNHYGILLQPELSNLKILTIGTGVSLLKSSSLDLIYHDYRLVERASALREARLDAALDGIHRGVGRGLDLVFALEEWERLEFEFSLAAFKRGRAFGQDAGARSYGAFVAMRYAF